ncbi:hypothetical protein P4O66_002881 [Electrophorus voltai]|uniref:Neuregulin C-terminal domain-containing protein n=1 Tax=Electrophorus voltai TaxID=2609070 RepID=A0AAD8YVA1_9TELE|nr:hypothetical protein P4O66_002881 [Electrophorus voltai]
MRLFRVTVSLSFHGRYVSALTTPARLSPVDFHYSLPPQVPTFQITSPNASHAVSLPPAARLPYSREDEPPLLLRRYQVPLHEAQRHEPYRQQQPGAPRPGRPPAPASSLPSSPQRPAQDDEYESTQEYPPALAQPKRSGRRWRRARLDGHVAPRGYRPPRDYGSRSCLSDSDSQEEDEEEEDGESTPFLSMQNMSTPEPVTVYRAAGPADTRTSQGAGGRHAARSAAQSRQTLARSKHDTAGH